MTWPDFFAILVFGAVLAAAVAYALAAMVRQ